MEKVLVDEVVSAPAGADTVALPERVQLISIQFGSPLLAMLLIASFVAFYILIVPFVPMQPARILVAYALDGILPSR